MQVNCVLRSGKIIHGQEDVRRLVEELARRVDHAQAGETQGEKSVAAQWHGAGASTRV